MEEDREWSRGGDWGLWARPRGLWAEEGGLHRGADDRFYVFLLAFSPHTGWRLPFGKGKGISGTSPATLGSTSLPRREGGGGTPALCPDCLANKVVIPRRRRGHQARRRDPASSQSGPRADRRCLSAPQHVAGIPVPAAGRGRAQGGRVSVLGLLASPSSTRSPLGTQDPRLSESCLRHSPALWPQAHDASSREPPWDGTAN